MLEIPRWLVLVVGSLVLIFGAYRVRLGLRSKQEEEKAKQVKGLYGLGRRTHLLIGLAYVLMGGMLVASGLGFRLPWVAH